MVAKLWEELSDVTKISPGAFHASGATVHLGTITGIQSIGNIKPQEIVGVFSNPRIDKLEKKVSALEETIKNILSDKEFQNIEKKELRIISYEEAKEEIKLYFKAQDGESIDPYDIMVNLNLDNIHMIIDICEELVKEGQIKEAG